jgi:hypothetical protein
MDMVSSWDPWPGSLEAWVPGGAGMELADRIDGLAVVAEASGPWSTWLLSDNVAVHTFRAWTSRQPRVRAVPMWTRGENGRKQVHPTALGLAAN